MYTIRLAVLVLMCGAPAVAAQSAGCKRAPSAMTADSTQSMSAEGRLIGANPLAALPRPESTTSTVRLSFIVVSSGRVAPWTVRVTGTEDRSWIVQARGMLARTRFKPLTRSHCGPPQWLYLTYAPRS
jgi:hypothetical protein